MDNPHPWRRDPADTRTPIAPPDTVGRDMKGLK